MKNMISTYISNVVKSVFAPAAFAFLFSILALPATVKAGDGITSTPVEVKLVGHIDENPVVRIEFSNAYHPWREGAPLRYADRFKN